MRNMKQSSDTDLEVLFPEHPWREPVRARFAGHVGGGPWVSEFFCCRFCLYRQGLVQAHLRDELPTFATVEYARAHLALAHPVDSWRIKTTV